MRLLFSLESYFFFYVKKRCLHVLSSLLDFVDSLYITF